VEQEAGGCVEDVKSSWLLVSRHSAVWRVTRHTLQVVLFSRDSLWWNTENSLSVSGNASVQSGDIVSNMTAYEIIGAWVSAGFRGTTDTH